MRKRDNLEGCKITISKPNSLNYPIIIEDENGRFLAGIHISGKGNTSKKFIKTLADALKERT